MPLIDLLPRCHRQRIVLASGSPRRAAILSSLGLRVEVRPSTFPEDLDKSAFPSPVRVGPPSDPGDHRSVATTLRRAAAAVQADYVKENARRKALEVFEADLAEAAARGEDKPAALVIGSDTVVEVDGRILEKPASEAAAAEMLGALSGRTHSVHSGVALVTPRRPRAAETIAGGGGGEGGGGVDAGERGGEDDAEGPVVVLFAERTEVRFAPLSAPLIAAYVATGEPMDKAGGYGIQGLGGQFVEGIVGDWYNVMGFPLHRFCREARPIVESWDDV